MLFAAYITGIYKCALNEECKLAVNKRCRCKTGRGNAGTLRWKDEQDLLFTPHITPCLLCLLFFNACLFLSLTLKVSVCLFKKIIITIKQGQNLAYQEAIQFSIYSSPKTIPIPKYICCFSKSLRCHHCNKIAQQLYGIQIYPQIMKH